MRNELDPNLAEVGGVPYYVERLRALAIELDLPEGAISERGLVVTATLLEETYQSSGNPSEDSYKEYHNDEHSFDVVSRAWRIIKIIQKTLPHRVDDDLYELAGITSAGQDVIHRLNAPEGESEVQSAVHNAMLMKEAGYDKAQIRRVYDGIIVSTVQRTDEGKIIQPYMRQGSTDLLKFVAGEADINGIIMEGPRRLMQDGVNLYLEQSKSSVKDMFSQQAGIKFFLHTQASFLEDRLADIYKDQAHYFSDQEIASLKPAFEREFNGQTREALRAARVLGQYPDRGESIVRPALFEAWSAAGPGHDHSQDLKQKAIELLIKQVQNK